MGGGQRKTRPLHGRQIAVDLLKAPSVAQQPVEIVERKGLGHPDSICDAIAERAALALVRAYRERVGSILHFNVDKGLLAAGRVERRFGGGRVVEPMRLVLGDRATMEAGGAMVPVAEIVTEAARSWFQEHLPRVDPARHLVCQVELRPAAPELASIFQGRKGPLPANDTSAAVGYAPLTETERLVLETERFLNSPDFKAAFPETGQDVKVMGFRARECLHLTVAMPLLDAYVESEDDYFRRKGRVLEALQAHLASQRGEDLCMHVYLNVLDAPGRGMAGMYLSVLGTSAEDSDSGQVGRGNRVNGLISLHRPAPAEAAAGKNPVSHPGKVYNVLSHVLAQRIYHQVPGISEVYVWLCSQIGSPLDQPLVAAAQVALAPGVTLARVSEPVRQLIASGLAEVQAFTDQLAEGQYTVF